MCGGEDFSVSGVGSRVNLVSWGRKLVDESRGLVFRGLPESCAHRRKGARGAAVPWPTQRNRRGRDSQSGGGGGTRISGVSKCTHQWLGHRKGGPQPQELRNELPYLFGRNSPKR